MSPVIRAEQIFDAFTRLILSDASGEDALLKNHFWPTLDNLFQRSIACQKDTAVWHDVFSELRCRLLPCLSDPDCVARAENVWQQIRVKISRNMERVQRCQRFRAAQQARSLQEIEQTLLITFHIEELMDVLAAELPRVNIPACLSGLVRRTAALTAIRNGRPNGRGLWWRTMKTGALRFLPADNASVPAGFYPTRCSAGNPLMRLMCGHCKFSRRPNSALSSSTSRFTESLDL